MQRPTDDFTAQTTFDVLASLHFSHVNTAPTPQGNHLMAYEKNPLTPASITTPLGLGWRPSYLALPAKSLKKSEASTGRPINSNIKVPDSLSERYKLRTEDERSDRAKANVLAFERLYRNVFCTQHAKEKGQTATSRDDELCRERDIILAQRRVSQAALSHGFAKMAASPTHNEIEWAYDRRVDALRCRDNASVTNSEIYRVVRYVCAPLTREACAPLTREACAPLTREALFEHIDRLIRDRYSMSYLFAYLKHLRRKYKRDFPLRGNERRAFTRSILQRYFDDYVPKRATDEIYASDESTYALMKNWCLRYLFDDTCTLTNRRNTRRAALRFVYTFLLMYYTGKRMSELCILRADDLVKLQTDRHIAIFIPKTRKLGRLSYRTIDANECAEFDAFLQRAVYLFRDCPYSPYRESRVIPFDQFCHRKSLNRYFDRVYARVTTEKKPRGLSFHSLRRRKAAISFERGVNLDNIREILDHSSTRITNNYINKHLVRSYRADKRHDNEDKSAIAS